MMKIVNNQAELDAALKAGETSFEIKVAARFVINTPAYPWISVTACVEAQVEAWESSRVEAWESSRVEAWESSRVEARGSSRVEAWESSRVEARGYVSIYAFGGTITMSAKCHAFIRSLEAKVTGGKKTMAITKNARDWCDEYGVDTKDGMALVYKAVREGFGSERDPSFKYTPGTKPKAPAFDKEECSHGLHASPSPKMAKEYFYSSSTTFVGMWVKIKDMLVFPEGSYPHKCKFKEVAKPVFQVDIDGKRIKKTVKKEVK